MSYRRGGAGGGYGQRRGRGGPNRGGGRGRGGRQDRGESGERRGPPPGLRGREIGLYYAQRSRGKKEARERNSRAVIKIDKASERNISRILSDVRQQSGRDGDQPQHSWDSRYSANQQSSSYDHPQSVGGHRHSGTSNSYSGGGDYWDSGVDRRHSGGGDYRDSRVDYQRSGGGDYWDSGVDHQHLGGGDYWNSGVDHQRSGKDDYWESEVDHRHTEGSSSRKEYNDRSRSPVRDSHKSGNAKSSSSSKQVAGESSSSSSQVAGDSSYPDTEDYQWSTIEEDESAEPRDQNFFTIDVTGSSSQNLKERTESSGTCHGESQWSTLDMEADSSSAGITGSLEGLGFGVGESCQLEGSLEMDKKLMEELTDAQDNNKKYKEMLKFRERLPSWKARNEILELIKNSQVSVVSGGTGCGKTTQVPQFIIDDAIRNGWGSRCHVICTQPRRISAIAVSQRVASERGEPHGVSSGYQIRLESKMPRPMGSVLYCTTGVLLRRLIGDPTLAEASHVIMDEVHERNISSDFLTIIMKDLLVRRPDLKLIMMSATINAEMFSKYFNNAPMYTIQNVVFPVTEYFLEDILAKTRYMPPPPKQRRIKYGRNRRKEMEEELANEEEKEEYLYHLESSRQYPSKVIDALRNVDDSQVDLNLAMEVIKYISTHMGEGAILVFMPGWDTISKLHDLLKGSPVFGGRNYRIIPLHSMMPTTTQQSVFDRPPPGVRKIVIATNIAETSITIDDVVFVIDCGKVKETTYDPNNQMACLEAVWVSKAAARQRRGRAGRVQEGHCFHLFTRYRHDKMEEFQMAEILRTPLEELILQIKILRLGQIVPFLDKAIESPDRKQIQAALQCLRDLNALTADEELTPLGRHLANLPVHPRIGKIILFGAIFSCLDPVLTIASSLGFKEPFVIPLNKQEEADAVKKSFAGDSHSDHIALLNAFKGWERARGRGDARQYCWDYFLAHNTLELLRNMKVQFAGLLHEVGFISSAAPNAPANNHNSDNMKLVKAVLCAGLYPNVIKIVTRKPGVPPKLYTKDGKVTFHPKSVNCDERYFDSGYMIYHTKMKSSSVFVHDCSTIPPLPLLFFGGNVSVQRDKDQETISVDDWIVFQAAQRTAELVQDLRRELDSVLERKVANPRMKLYDPTQQSDSPTSKLIKAIMDLITTEDYSRQATRLASGKHLYS